MNALVKSSSGITQVPIESKLLSEQRKVFIDGEIDEKNAIEFVKQIIYLNSEGDDRIDVFISSPGGEINSGLLMYDAITGSKAPIRTFCLGKAYSMGAILFSCAKERCMLPNSELMLHQPLLGGRVSGNASSIKSISDSLLDTKEKMNKILATHTGKKKDEIDEATSYDHYFSPEEAIEFNLADKVVDFNTLMEGCV